MIIDIHTHCYPDDVAASAVETRSKRFGIPPVTDGTVSGLRQRMAESDTDLAVVHPIAMKPEQTVKMNRWAKAQMGGNIICFGTLHPDYTNWKDKLKWLTDNGFKGIKFHADCQGYDADDIRMMRIYEAVFKAGLVGLFHCGTDLAFTSPYRCTPKRMRNVADAFGEAKIIAAHMGGFRCWEESEEYLIGQNIYFDTTYSIHELGAKRSVELILKHGADKILFGTDSPWRKQADDIALIRSLDISPDAKDAILGQNAAALLGIQ